MRRQRPSMRGTLCHSEMRPASHKTPLHRRAPLFLARQRDGPRCRPTPCTKAWRLRSETQHLLAASPRVPTCSNSSQTGQVKRKQRSPSTQSTRALVWLPAEHCCGQLHPATTTANPRLLVVNLLRLYVLCAGATAQRSAASANGATNTRLLNLVGKRTSAKMLEALGSGSGTATDPEDGKTARRQD